MGRKRAGWTRLSVTRSERDQPPEHPPGAGGSPGETEEQKKGFSKRRKKTGIPQEGGHSQSSISEQENLIREGGHSQSSNGINPHREKIDEGGHSQASTGKHLHYGHHGRYNDNIDF